jgi:hypothetical protein
MTRHSILGAGKTPDWAGATPLLTAFTRPKFRGVAPARHHRTVTVFCPRAYRNVFDPKSRDEENPIAERRRS